MVSKKRMISLLAALVFCLSSVVIPVSAIEEQTLGSTYAAGWSCSDWVETDPLKLKKTNVGKVD